MPVTHIVRDLDVFGFRFFRGEMREHRSLNGLDFRVPRLGYAAV
jgi:hypothetical protein